MTIRLRPGSASRASKHLTQFALLAVPLALAGACDTGGTDTAGDSDGQGGADSGTGGNGSDVASDQGTDLGSDLGSDLGGETGGGGEGTGGAGGAGPVCETASSETELLPVYLAVAFDVSGSMGNMQPPEWWYDPKLKWTPVAQAMRAFFADDEAQGISALMGLFPSSEAEDRCAAATYEDPEVPMTGLPSTAFDAVLDDYEEQVGTPLESGAWRGRTPTLAAVQGIGTALDDLRAAEPEANFAMVLVTDGLPTGCDDDSLASVSDAIAALAAEGVPTYVIGIQNPTEPPAELPPGWDDWGNCTVGPGGGDTPCEPEDNLDALGQLAIAGGTEEALLLNTDDPTATQEELTEAMLQIARASVSCNVPIPPHPNDGETFEPDYVDVVAGLDGDDVRLDYDETCELDLSWHYDDADNPTSIELCEETCAAVQADPNGSLTVQFLCEARPPVVK
jgi:hypothetical protein